VQYLQQCSTTGMRMSASRMLHVLHSLHCPCKQPAWNKVPIDPQTGLHCAVPAMCADWWQGSCTLLLTPHWPTCLMCAQHTLTRLWPYLQESCGDAWAGIRLCWQQARVALQLVAVVVPAKVCLVSAHVSKVDNRLSISLPPLPFPGRNTDTAAVLLLGPSRNNHPCLPQCRSGSVTHKS
jgi:hypothetical protein